MSTYITLDRQDAIATVTLNRPSQRNAIGYHGWLELKRVADGLAADGQTKVVVLTGKGDEAFSSGADIKDFDQYRNDSTQAKRYAEAFESAADAIESLPKPTICLIRGYCVGGGCELSMAADVRISADNGRFGIPAARLGIVVGYAEMHRLVSLVGPGNASYLLLSGRMIDAEEAFRIGLVNRVIPGGEIDQYVYELAREMAALSALSHRGHKSILQTVLRNRSLAELTTAEEHVPFANFDSSDYVEGRQAFQEGRSPRFKGTIH